MTTWQRDPRVLWRRSFDTIVVLPPTAADPFQLDGVGRTIWELLDQPVAEDQLITELAQAYEQPPSEVAANVGPFLQQLRQAGAVRST